ncbi:MAG: HipA N-terminal domain-containing protein [Desulfovibrio sp.]|nr:HipA N-terminal domain-containing protein [Desulfovibrio sp.]
MYDEVIVTDGTNKKIGTLFFRRGRGQEYQEFMYEKSWLRTGFQIDPELPLSERVQRAASFSFGCFSDATPDSWGRALLRRFLKKKKKEIFFLIQNIFFRLQINGGWALFDFLTRILNSSHSMQKIH